MMHAMDCNEHRADLLCRKIDALGSPLCVGIDPVASKVPSQLRHLHELDAIQAFSSGVIDAVAGTAVAVKFQSACFERYGAKGVALLGKLREHAAQVGLVIILDAKRGDIGITAQHYAASATIDGPCDWITVNPYLGMDSIAPFLETGLGVFCLVRTSNPSGDAVQKQHVQDGRTVAESIADLLKEEGEAYIGDSGWSSLGVVVGATKPDEAIALRKRMPHQIFLMPGIGAQGATPQDVIPCFADGHGAIVPASRSVLYPKETTDWQTDIANAAKQLAADLQVGVS
ncbi:MAG: orotidine-5'-phosphate decarboxylase [Phycisphaerales bacterium]|jgi:orotidine-5'-phosphate decarboxylase|nr:orotidine-5'-phosphate decarboxylase [Phycisphaerales bacterium]